MLHIHTNNLFVCSFEKFKKIYSFMVCSCLLESSKLTFAEGHKFQKEVKNALNGDLGLVFEFFIN